MPPLKEFSSTRSRFEAKLDEARSRIDDARILVTRKVCGAADATSAYLHENPGTVIGVATAVEADHRLSDDAALLAINH